MSERAFPEIARVGNATRRLTRTGGVSGSPCCFWTLTVVISETTEFGKRTHRVAKPPPQKQRGSLKHPTPLKRRPPHDFFPKSS